MESRESQRDTYNGFGDSLARAFELAATPAVFGFIGYWLDGKFGIRPVLTIVLSLLTLITMGIRTAIGYDQQMRRHEAEGSWAAADKTRRTPSLVPSVKRGLKATKRP